MFKNLKTHEFAWGGSSVGEHMTEDHGVESSILSRPILKDNIYKAK